MPEPRRRGAPVIPSLAVELRTHLHRALRRAGVPEARVEPLVLAAWEALVNVADHGCGVPQLVVTHAAGVVRVCILDPHPAAPRPPLPDGSYRSPTASTLEGRGLALIAAGADDVEVVATGPGVQLGLSVRLPWGT